MIQINKPAQAPKKLRTEGAAETEKNKNLFINGNREFSFKKEVYGHTTVKEALRKAQHGKCCFCERKEEIGDVEHFRPKAAFKQKDKEKLTKPGYYWLAYDWDNLLFCCPKCNRSYKKNYFPLTDPDKRALSYTDDISLENPLIIHPCYDNPEDYIEFIRESPRAINGNKKGKITIKRTGIDRPFLDEGRNKVYKIYKYLYQILQSPDTDLELKTKTHDLLNEAAQDTSEFASMIRCAIKNEFRY